MDQVGERVPAVDALGGRLLADGPMVVCRGLPDDPSTWRFSANAERVLGWPAPPRMTGPSGWSASTPTTAAPLTPRWPAS